MLLQGAHDKKIGKAPQTFNDGKYVYIYWPPMKTRPPERLPTNSYRKIVSPKVGPSTAVEVSSSKVTIKEDGISNTVSINRVILAPTLHTFKIVMNDAKNGNHEE